MKYLEGNINILFTIVDVPESIQMNFKYTGTSSWGYGGSNLEILEHGFTTTLIQQELFDFSRMSLLSLHLLFCLDFLLQLLDLVHEFLEADYGATF